MNRTVFQQRTSASGKEKGRAQVTHAEAILHFKKLPVHLRWEGCKKTLPLLVEGSQAPRGCTAVSYPGPAEFGSCSAISSLASTPSYERSLQAQGAEPTKH